jgi:CIC family chloride channel protein
MRDKTGTFRLLSSNVDWRTRILGNYLQKWVVLGALIGVVAGVGAIVFFEGIKLATEVFLEGGVGLDPPLPRGEGLPNVTSASRLWLLPLVVVAGGLISGVVVFFLAPEAEGHGTDAAIEAFHERAGKIRSHVPLVKMVASAVTIGSGGSAGREGPTAQIAAGFGSWLGDIFKLDPADRRIAVAVGVGAGIGSIFKAPLGGAILSAEVLYMRDFELAALIPGFIASVIGYSIFAGSVGWTPVFGDATGLEFTQPGQLVWYSVLGVIAGLGGIAYARFFYGTRNRFQRLKIPPHFKPAIGALGVGLIALAFPEVLSMGYGWLQLAMEGNKAELAVSTMLALVGLKIVATSLTIGSGGSGGVFAPGLFIGGMLGGSMWWLLHNQVGWMPDTPAPFVIVGMTALFGGVAKAPIAVIIMVAEMTGEFSMVVPAMIATGIAYLVTGNITIYENQVPTRADSPAHRGEFTIPLIQTISVGQAMRAGVITASPDEGAIDAEQRMKTFGLRGLPVVQDGRLVGMFTEKDALYGRQEGVTTVGEAMSTDPVVAYPGDSVHTALQRMTRARVSRLPVVERAAPDKLLGIVTMRDVGNVLDLEVRNLGQRRLPTTSDPLRSVLVREAMSRKFESVPQSLSIKRVANRIAAAAAHAAVVLDDEGFLTGIVTLGDLAAAADDGADRPVGTVATRSLVTTRQDQNVAEALAQPGAEGLRQIVVVQEQKGKLRPVGLLNRSDVVAAYLRSRDRQARVARRARSLEREHAGRTSTIDLLIGPSDVAAGRTLAELRLPSDAVVTAVVRDGAVVVPRGQVRLKPGDRVQVLASSGVRDAVIRRLTTDGAPPAR